MKFAGRGIKTILIIIFFLFPAVSAFSDEIRVPFPVYVDDFKHDAKKIGIDLDGKKKSIGFVEDRGSRITIFTYKPFPTDKLELLTKLTFKNLRK